MQLNVSVKKNIYIYYSSLIFASNHSDYICSLKAKGKNIAFFPPCVRWQVPDAITIRTVSRTLFIQICIKVCFSSGKLE